MDEPFPGWRREGAGETVFHTPIFSLRREPWVCVRTGAAGEYYSFDCPDWVNVVALTPERELVMIRQFRHGNLKVELEIPGGGVAAGESPVAAGIRELREETGFAGENPRLIGSVCPNPALQGNLCHTVMIENVVDTGILALEPTEDIETSLAPLDEVERMIRGGVITHGLVLNALQFLFLAKSSPLTADR